MPRLLLTAVILGGLLLSGCRSTEKSASDRQTAAPTSATPAQPTPTPDHLTTGGIELKPEPTPLPVSSGQAAKIVTAPPAPPLDQVSLGEEETTTRPIQPVRVNILLTIDLNIDGNYVARFEGDFFPRILRAMHADLTEIPPLILVDGKPAKYTVTGGRSQLILQVRADATGTPQQVLVSYRLTLIRPSQSGSAFQREAENLVWKLGETRALMGKLPNK